MKKEHGNWHVRTTCFKYREDIAPFKTAGNEALFFSLYKPYKVLSHKHNLLLNEGINALWTLVCGGAETAYSNANARIGVGDSATAALATQTGLLGTAAYAGMDGGFPTYGTLQKAVFQASFGDAVANFVWNEWSVDNGNAANKNLNRKVENNGTKTSGTWVFQVSITIS